MARVPAAMIHCSWPAATWRRTNEPSELSRLGRAGFCPCKSSVGPRAQPFVAIALVGSFGALLVLGVQQLHHQEGLVGSAPWNAFQMYYCNVLKNQLLRTAHFLV